MMKSERIDNNFMFYREMERRNKRLKAKKKERMKEFLANVLAGIALYGIIGALLLVMIMAPMP